ncbi:DUF1934 domain-containing protein [Sutcliffiella cohnii]
MRKHVEGEKIPINISFRSEIHHEGEKEVISFRTKGHYYIKGQQTFLVFTEEQPGAGKVNVIYKLSEREVWVSRAGSIKMRQSYRLGEQTAGIYENELGAFQLTINTNKMMLMKDDIQKRGSVQMEYELNVHGQSAGTYFITLHFEEVSSA